MASASDEKISTATTVTPDDELTDDQSIKKREAFGNRHLTDKQNVFEFNAW